MVVADQSDGLGLADVVNGLDAGAYLVQSEAVAFQNLSVTFCMQLGKSAAEFECFVFYCDGAIGSQTLGSNFFGQCVRIDAEEVAYVGLFQLEEARNAVVGGDVHDVFLDFSKM